MHDPGTRGCHRNAPPTSLRIAERFDKLFADGNYKDAYEGFRRLALDPKTEPDRVGTDLMQAVRCLASSVGR